MPGEKKTKTRSRAKGKEVAPAPLGAAAPATAVASTPPVTAIPPFLEAIYTNDILPALYALFVTTPWPLTLVHELAPGEVPPRGWVRRTLLDVVQELVDTLAPGNTYRVEINHTLYKKVSPPGLLHSALICTHHCSSFATA
jgi:hypothetical protein